MACLRHPFTLFSPKQNMTLALIGATGLVGRTMLDVLVARQFPYSRLLLAASDASAGSTLVHNGVAHTLQTVQSVLEQAPTIALFSAGGAASLAWAPKFAAAGTLVIDNSSAWRMDPTVPLVVPEVNPEAIAMHRSIIANPNCSTIQLVVALWPLHQAFGLQAVVVSTYQSVSGSGQKGISQLEAEEADTDAPLGLYAHPIHRNAVPHCDVFVADGYTREEMKLVLESRKIMGLPGLPVSPTAVRVPVVGGHSEAVHAVFAQPVCAAQAQAVLAQAPGIVLMDDPARNHYPTPRQAHHQDNVLVGRIRQDMANPNALNLWVVADNLRKGAATNAVQIAEAAAAQL